MKVAVVGAGAIGGLLGARLALAGADVTFLARNRNLEAIRARGFALIDEAGARHAATSAKATDDARALGPCDAVFLTVKAQQVADVLPQVTPLLGPTSMLVTMINGVPWWYFQRLGGAWEGRTLESIDPGGAIARAIDPACVVGSVVYPAAMLVEAGVVRHVEGNRFTLGELDGTRTPRIEALSRLLMDAGFKAPVARDIRTEIWVKLWGNCSFNPASALTGATLEGIARDPAGRAAVRALMVEAETVARALGIDFRIGVDQRIAGAEAVGPHKTSMLQDLEAGRPLEVDALVGSVVELGRIAGVPTPGLAVVDGLVRLRAATRHAAA